jgi:translation elongation factor EF-G
MDKRGNIRNLTITGEMDKGKTTLTESLVAASKEQEKKRCITNKST